MKNVKQEKMNMSGDLGFLASEKGIRQWIVDLPMLNRGKALQMIYQLLVQVKSFPLSWRTRYFLYEQLDRPLHVLLDSLKVHYKQNLFPLTRKAHQMAEISRQIHLLMMMGFEKSYRDWDTEYYVSSDLKGHARRQLINKRKAESTYPINALILCFYHAENIISVCSLCGLNFPSDFWLKLHALYVSSETHDWLDIKTMVGSVDHPMSHEIAYKRCLLLSMLSPQQLDKRDLESIQDNLDIWANVLQLNNGAAEMTLDNNNFYVVLDQDQPPRPIHQSYNLNDQHTSAQHLLLNSQKIYARIKQIEAGCSSNLPESLQQLKVATLSLLLRQWWSTPSRNTKRYQKNGKVEVLFSFAALHNGLSSDLGIETGQCDVGKKSDFGLKSDSQVQFELKKKIDPWKVSEQEHDFTYTNLELAEDKVKDEKRVKYSGIECQVLDSNSGGYQLSVAKSAIKNLRIGDMIGIRDVKAHIWNMASIRWMRTGDEKHVLMGVQLHYPNGLPLSFHIINRGQTSKTIPCFLTVDNQLPLLLFPTIENLKNKVLHINFKKMSVCVKLEEEHLMASSRFDVWSFSSKYFPAGKSWKTQDLEELMREVTTKPVVAVDRKFEPTSHLDTGFQEVFNSF